MGSTNLPVRHSGIYHNLPTFDPGFTGMKAIVTGANGISGFHTMRVLLESPQRWEKIYALSRRPPPEEMMKLLPAESRSRVEHVACDFLESPETIAEALKKAKVTASHVFFYSYLQPKVAAGAAAWSNVEVLVEVNTKLLSNFLNALPLANISVSRVLLQTGAKNYGIHLGRARTPSIESDPQPKHLEPNFYYPQEEILFKFCKEHAGTSWNVIRPAWIIGAVNNAQMNALHPWAIYAAVQAHKNEPIVFPGDWDSWQSESHHSTAMLTGYLSEWAALEEKTKNEAFNSQDTSPLSWDRFFEELARWFAVEKGIVPPPDDEAKYQVVYGKSGKETPIGYGPPLVFKTTFSLVQWASEPANAEAWKQIMQASNGKVTDDPFADIEANFVFGDAAFLKMGSMCMNKARRLGWTGFVDTRESLFQAYTEFAKLGMIPEMKATSPRALV